MILAPLRRLHTGRVLPESGPTVNLAAVQYVPFWRWTRLPPRGGDE